MYMYVYSQTIELFASQYWVNLEQSPEIVKEIHVHCIYICI